MTAAVRGAGIPEEPAARWAWHMRRAAEQGSEDDYLEALDLVPAMPDRRQSLVKTLRGLAGLYADQGRLEEAIPLFESVAQEASAPTKIFWCDYVRLMFKAAEQRFANKESAAASHALERARQLSENAPGHPEMAALCREGYLQVGGLFEQAGSFVQADLYLDRALAIVPGPGAEDGLQIVAGFAWKAFRRGDFRRCDAWIKRGLALSPHSLSSRSGILSARVAALLAALGGSAAQMRAAKQSEHYFSWGEAILREAQAQGSVELADLLVAWGSCSATPRQAEQRFREALEIRKRLLGPRHSKTRELESALGFGADSGFKQGFAPLQKPLAQVLPRAASALEIKALYRRLAKLAHPDQAQSDEEFEARNLMMGEINAASKAGDGSRLARLAARTRAELKKKGWLRE